MGRGCSGSLASRRLRLYELASGKKCQRGLQFDVPGVHAVFRGVSGLRCVFDREISVKLCPRGGLTCCGLYDGKATHWPKQREECNQRLRNQFGEKVGPGKLVTSLPALWAQGGKTPRRRLFVGKTLEQQQGRKNITGGKNITTYLATYRTVLPATYLQALSQGLQVGYHLRVHPSNYYMCHATGSGVSSRSHPFCHSSRCARAVSDSRSFRRPRPATKPVQKLDTPVSGGGASINTVHHSTTQAHCTTRQNTAPR